MGYIKVKSPEGVELSVTEKAFELLYKPRGYTVAVKAKAAKPSESEVAANGDDTAEVAEEPTADKRDKKKS